ncbi:MAG: hypothetical protein OH337_04075 [Candidatus Parvarchaeota archaeon]|nr:hypothetical protein [Candidatus Haiyanarchaeum thermophilum]
MGKDKEWKTWATILGLICPYATCSRRRSNICCVACPSRGKTCRGCSVIELCKARMK